MKTAQTGLVEKKSQKEQEKFHLQVRNQSDHREEKDEDGPPEFASHRPVAVDDFNDRNDVQDEDDETDDGGGDFADVTPRLDLVGEEGGEEEEGHEERWDGETLG